jgi:ribonucleoside-diphosphate reductase beta chain
MGNMIMEGTCFPSEFTKIYYIYDFLRILGGLYKANEFISRDENTHVQFGVYNYIHHVENKLSTAVVHAMMREAASVMAEFINDSIPEPMVIMNAPHLIQYVHFVQDNLCTVLGYDKIWGVTNPFSFMEKQSYGVRISDFFVDKSISEYGHTRANLDASDATMDFSEDF